MPYLATQSFAGPDNRVISLGQEVPDDDPIVKGREALFAKTDQPLPKGPTSAGVEDFAEKEAPKPRKRAASKAAAE